MKKLRVLILVTIITMLCTGCTIEYNINITKDTIEETINVVDNITYSRTKEDILNHYNMWYPVFVTYVKEGESIELEDFSTKVNGIEYYDKNINETEIGYNYSYKYTYDIDDYYDSYALATTFIEPNVYKNKKSLVLKSSKENLLCTYDYFEEVKIKITVDPQAFSLNYTNTEDIHNNTYTWTLNRDNCQNSQIILTLDTISKDINEDILDNNNDNIVEQSKKDYSLYIFYAILIICVLIGAIIFNKIKKKNSKMNEDD